MSDVLNQKINYQSTAYNSQTLSPQVRPLKQHRLIEKLRKRGQIFPFSRTNKSIATMALREQSPSLVNGDGSLEDLFWNHRIMQPYSFVSWAHVYLFIAGIAKFVLYFIYPLLFLMSLSLVFSDGGIQRAVSDFLQMTIYVALPAFIIYSPILLINKFDPNINKDQLERWFARKKYCLNRETGMVTLYGTGNRKVFTHPFIEFDCILAGNPNHQGLLSYRLMLIHRYSNYKYGVNIGSLVGMNAPVAEYHRLWNMIQQYMDVSKPLPDIPMLEPFRHLDPTTAEYDQQTHRDPRYWRQMSDEEFEAQLTKIAKAQEKNNIPASGPILDIFAKA